MNRAQRRALMAQELNEQEVEVVDVDAIDPVAPEAPVLAPAFDPALVAQIVAATVAALKQTETPDIGAQLAQALKDGRQPKPETYLTGGYHERSHYHPDGVDAPVPVLEHRTFYGVWDHERGKAIAAWEIDGQVRDDEVEAINSLQPGEYRIEHNDGVQTPFHVVDVKGEDGATKRRILAFPKARYDKATRNSVPSLTRIAAQVREQIGA